MINNLYPRLEQPKEEWKAKKGGSVDRPKNRNLNSKKYSRSLEATNELFTIHEFFQKPSLKLDIGLVLPLQ